MTTQKRNCPLELSVGHVEAEIQRINFSLPKPYNRTVRSHTVGTDWKQCLMFRWLWRCSLKAPIWDFEQFSQSHFEKSLLLFLKSMHSWNLYSLWGEIVVGGELVVSGISRIADLERSWPIIRLHWEVFCTEWTAPHPRIEISLALGGRGRGGIEQDWMEY